jgi:hypothetical protein
VPPGNCRGPGDDQSWRVGIGTPGHFWVFFFRVIFWSDLQITFGYVP